MDLSRDFIQYEIDNPHNVAFKSLVSYENREDTIEGFRKLLMVLVEVGFCAKTTCQTMV